MCLSQKIVYRCEVDGFIRVVCEQINVIRHPVFLALSPINTMFFESKGLYQHDTLDTI